MISFISECHIFLNHFHNISKVNFSSRSLIVWVLQQNVFRFVYFDASSVILQDKIVEWPHEIRTHITNIQIYGGFSRILFQWTILTGMWVCVCVNLNRFALKSQTFSTIYFIKINKTKDVSNDIGNKRKKLLERRERDIFCVWCIIMVWGSLITLRLKKTIYHLSCIKFISRDWVCGGANVSMSFFNLYYFM